MLCNDWRRPRSLSCDWWEVWGCRRQGCIRTRCARRVQPARLPWGCTARGAAPGTGCCPLLRLSAPRGGRPHPAAALQHGGHRPPARQVPACPARASPARRCHCSPGGMGHGGVPPQPRAPHCPQVWATTAAAGGEGCLLGAAPAEHPGPAAGPAAGRGAGTGERDGGDTRCHCSHGRDGAMGGRGVSMGSCSGAVGGPGAAVHGHGGPINGCGVTVGDHGGAVLSCRVTVGCVSPGDDCSVGAGGSRSPWVAMLSLRVVIFTLQTGRGITEDAHSVTTGGSSLLVHGHVVTTVGNVTIGGHSVPVGGCWCPCG